MTILLPCLFYLVLCPKHLLSSRVTSSSLNSDTQGPSLYYALDQGISDDRDESSLSLSFSDTMTGPARDRV